MFKFPIYRLMLLAILFCFIYQAVSYFDPDFGWHLKMGELIIKNGIPRVDPFSYTMPSFPVVSHEWLVDLFLYIVYTKLGYFYLALFFSIIAILALLISTQGLKVKSNLFKLGVIMISASVIIPYMGVRPQVLSWLFLATLVWYIRAKISLIKHTKNPILCTKLHLQSLFLPLIFFTWANLHGSFGAGLAFLALFLIGQTVRTRVFCVTDFIVATASVLVTLINPYGLGLWREIWSSVSDNQLRWRIAEWNPSILQFNLSYVFFIAFSISLVYLFWAKFKLEYKLIYFFFLIQAVLSSRHVPLWVIVSMPLLLHSWNIFYKQIKDNKVALMRLRKVMNVAIVVFLFLFAFSVFMSYQSYNKLKSDNFYPVNAVKYLESNLPEDNIFSEYSWGGYLIWNLPQKKVFIDGRMPSWRWKANIDGETNNAMDDYLEVLRGKLHFKVPFEEYRIGTVLLPKRIIKDESWKPSVLDSLLEIWLGIENPRFDLAHDLERNQWQKVYEDDIAVIFERPN